MGILLRTNPSSRSFEYTQELPSGTSDINSKCKLILNHYFTFIRVWRISIKFY